jgi:hypothetical protein
MTCPFDVGIKKLLFPARQEGRLALIDLDGQAVGQQPGHGHALHPLAGGDAALHLSDVDVQNVHSRTDPAQFRDLFGAEALGALDLQIGEGEKLVGRDPPVGQKNSETDHQHGGDTQGPARHGHDRAAQAKNESAKHRARAHGLFAILAPGHIPANLLAYYRRVHEVPAFSSR